MSIWTQVAGVVRIDSIRFLQQDNLDFGKICKYDDPQPIWDMCNVPCGSEGSLEYTVRENPEESHLAAYVLTVFGDLREYENLQEIIDYFNSIADGRMIRSGIFRVDINSDSFCYSYDSEKSEWVSL